MRKIYALFIICLAALRAKAQVAELPPDMWTPSGEQTRDDWLRCHGFPCTTWDSTRRKLQELKMMIEKPDSQMEPMYNDTDDSLDGCIWLTGEQLDEIFARMESELKDKMEAIHGNPGESRRRRRRRKRKVTKFSKDPYSMWPTKTVHWKFDGQHYEDERQIIRGAFSHWEQQTCMRFKELGTNELFSDNHILITRENTGCHSFIGRITTIPQQLNLQKECLYTLGTPVHEIGHALGFWHEQQRSDRDGAIKILWDNLGYYVGQFYKQDTDNITPYDYGSVMHYAPKKGGFANGKNTMETLNPLYQHTIGQRTGLSFLDAKAINLVYCQDACSVPLTGCQHGGYQDPNDCSRCKCPDGLSGTFCEKVAPPENAQCGGDYTLSSNPLYIESPGYNNTPYQNHMTCSWRIKAPAGSHVSLKFEGEFAVYAYEQQQCHHWVEVRYKQDIGAQGPRFCGYQRPSDTVISEGNEMLVVFKTNWTDNGVNSRIGFRAKLEIVNPNSAYTTTVVTSTTTTTTASTTTTTTVYKTTTTTTIPTTSGCEVADLMLVMDSSGGVTENNWPKVLKFASDIVKQFSIGQEAVRVGVVTYSGHAELSVPFESTQTVSQVSNAISGIPFLGESTNTHSGFLMMRSHFTMYGRPNVRKIAIHITDGQTALPYLAIQQASYARSEDIELYVTGIDKNFDYSEAASMVSDNKHIIQIESFQDLISSDLNYGLAVAEMICGQGEIESSSDLSWSCDFEDDTTPFCGMIQDRKTDQFDWTRQTGRTPSGATGPEWAFSGKYYAYIEASDPRQPGDEAILYLPKFNVQGRHCLSFAYHMYGFHIRTLQIAKKTADGSIVPLWLQAGEQGKRWLTSSLYVNLRQDDQLMIIARRGDAYSGDIAIDSLQLAAGECLPMWGNDVIPMENESSSAAFHSRSTILLSFCALLIWFTSKSSI